MKKMPDETRKAIAEMVRTGVTMAAHKERTIMNHQDMITRKTRLDLRDSLMDVMQKLSEGNPGALRVCLDLMNETPKIDPDGFMGGVGPLLSLDSLGLYGPRIWMFYKDICGENLVTMLALMRGVQLGFLDKKLLTDEIDGRITERIDIINIVNRVRTRLPKFAANP